MPLVERRFKELAKYQRLQRGKNGLIEPFEMAGFVGAELKTMSKRLAGLILAIFVVWYNSHYS